MLVTVYLQQGSMHNENMLIFRGCGGSGGENLGYLCLCNQNVLYFEEMFNCLKFQLLSIQLFWHKKHISVTIIAE